MNCQEVQAQLSDYLDLSLGATRLVPLEEHLAACSPCREEAELLSKTIRQVAALPVLETPLGFTQRVMSHVRETETQPSFWHRLLLPLSSKIPAQATALVIVGILGIYLLQKQEPHGQFAPATIVDAGKQGGAALTEADSPAQVNPPAAQPDSSPAQATAPMPSADRRLQPGRQNEDARRSENVDLPPAGNVPAPSSRAPKPAEPPIRTTPVISSTPVVTGAPQTGSGAAPFAEPAAPATIVPFADLELIVRRHTTVLTGDAPGAVRQTEANQAAAERDQAPARRPIERLMAAIPDHTRPQTIWIKVPENQYEEFKRELHSLGTIESETRVPLLRDQGASHDGHVRVKLTALPAGETAPADPANGR